MRVEGKLQTGELKFSETKSLIFDQKSVSIIIQLERPDYKHDVTCIYIYIQKPNLKIYIFKIIHFLIKVRFRCIAMYPDLTIYFGTMDIFIYSPDGFILRRWENVQTSNGVISLEFLINDEPPAGEWKIKAVVMGYEAIKIFNVIQFYQWKYEVNVSMPHYFLTTSPGVAGVVVAK